MNNGTTFRSATLQEVSDKWEDVFCRAAIGLSKRHLTVKARTERSCILLMEVVFRYNISPKTEDKKNQCHDEQCLNMNSGTHKLQL